MSTFLRGALASELEDFFADFNERIPADIRAAMAAADAGFITGQTLFADGGASLGRPPD